MVFLTGLLGFALLWLIPFYIRSACWSCCLMDFGPLIYYIIGHRNPHGAGRPQGDDALPHRRGGERPASNKMGMNGRSSTAPEDGLDSTGPPIVFIGKSQGKLDHDPRGAKAEDLPLSTWGRRSWSTTPS